MLDLSTYLTAFILLNLINDIVSLPYNCLLDVDRLGESKLMSFDSQKQLTDCDIRFYRIVLESKLTSFASLAIAQP